MSQLVACKNERGIILATDSKAIDFEPTGRMVDYTVERLIQLTPYTAILAGGAALPFPMPSSQWKDFNQLIKRSGIT